MKRSYLVLLTVIFSCIGNLASAAAIELDIQKIPLPVLNDVEPDPPTFGKQEEENIETLKNPARFLFKDKKSTLVPKEWKVQ